MHLWNDEGRDWIMDKRNVQQLRQMRASNQEESARIQELIDTEWAMKRRGIRRGGLSLQPIVSSAVKSVLVFFF